MIKNLAPMILILIIIAGCGDGSSPSSSDSTTPQWSVVATNVAGSLNDVIWNGTLYAAVGDSSVFTSYNGKNWEKVATSSQGELYTIGWNNGKFYCGGVKAILYTDDTGGWHEIAISDTLYDIAISPTRTVFAGTNCHVLVKDSGWSVINEDYTMYDVLYVPGFDDGCNYFMHGNSVSFISEDGVNWTQRDIIVGRYIDPGSIAYYRGWIYVFRSVLKEGCKASGLGQWYSLDYSDYDPEQRVHSMLISEPAGKKIYAVGTNGLLMVGSEYIDLGITTDLNSICIVGSNYMIVGDSGIVVMYK